MKVTLALLILCASCTFRKDAEPKPATAPVVVATVALKAKPEPAIKSQSERELEKILHWFEQMDAIYREALWVIRKERAPQAKSMFGKMQRALLTDMKQKLSNKSLFKCDVYSMKRDVMGLAGIPQKAEVFHKCNSKESFIPIGDWSYTKANEFTVNFQGSNLSEVLGFATSILSPRIQCKLKSTDSGLIESFHCENLMIDFDPAKNQVLKFTKFEFTKSARSILQIKAEVLENLDPVRKIEVEVPMEGKITVVETVLQAPEYVAKQVPGEKSNSNQEKPKNEKKPQEGSQENSQEGRPESRQEGRQESNFPPGVGIQAPQQNQEEGQQQAQPPEIYPNQEQQQQEPQNPQQQAPPPEIPREQNTR
jgi:hypothetical protein